MKDRRPYLKQYYMATIGRATTGYCVLCGALINNNRRNSKKYCECHTMAEIKVYRREMIEKKDQRQLFTKCLIQTCKNQL